MLQNALRDSDRGVPMWLLQLNVSISCPWTVSCWPASELSITKAVCSDRREMSVETPCTCACQKQP